jgi:hypothetical protein
MADADPVARELMLGNENVVEGGISETDSINQILHWIGFRSVAQAEALFNDCVSSWDSIKELSNEDIEAQAKSFAARRTGKIIFGTNRSKFLKALAHWVQDFHRVSGTPSIEGLSEGTFTEQLRRAQTRNKIRKALKSNDVPSESSPGPLEKESKWKEWEEKFVNYLRLHLGANGVPLSYVIRANDDPDTEDIWTQTDFIRETVACAPLSGEFYDADKLTVYNLIISFTTGQPSGDWVKKTEKAQDGRKSMQALRDHFLGEGNGSRNISDAEALKNTLVYKNERSMAFETFLTQTQRMFNIYSQEGEPMLEPAKIRFLFDSVQHDKLTSTIEALKAQNASGAALSYTQCCNHLTTAVSRLPEYLHRNRNISGVERSTQKSGSSSIYNSDGTINATGQITGWEKLSSLDKRLVYKERKRLGVKFGGGNSNNRGKNTRNSNHGKEANTMQQLKNHIRNQKRQIQALKRADPEKSDADDEANDAGDEFGGKNSKKKKSN